MPMFRFDEDKDVFVPRRLHFFGAVLGRARDGRHRGARNGRKVRPFRGSPPSNGGTRPRTGPDYRNITMQPPAPVHDSYYPWLGEPVASYFARYPQGRRPSVLFIMGEPGTGKTSLFCAHFIYQNQLKAVITYEEKLLNTDEMFVNFLSMGDDAVMVIEDAESLVNAREVGGGTTLDDALSQCLRRARSPGQPEDHLPPPTRTIFAAVDPALNPAGALFRRDQGRRR